MIELDPLAEPRWLDLLARAPAATPFHHPAWLALLGRSFRYEMSACCVEAADGSLAGGLPVAEVSSRLTGRRLVALPFSDLCEPLLARDAPAGSAIALGDALSELQRRRGVPLEVRGTGPALREAPPGERFHHHVLALGTDAAEVERRFAKSQVRRGIRRAQREGLETAVATDRGRRSRAFFRLHVVTRQRLACRRSHGASSSGFESLFEAGLGFVLLVRREGAPAAAGVFLTQGDTLLYKYGASDARFLPLRPNNLLFWDAIRWGCAHGMRWLDFGRTHWDHESLRAFKLAWGRRSTSSATATSAPRRRAAAASARQRALARVIRRSPPLAGRVIGEALYRHAG